MKSYLKLTAAQYDQIREETVAVMPAQTKQYYSVVMENFEVAAYERGEHNATTNLTLKMADKRFGTLSDALRQRISALPTGKVEAMGLALFDFETQDELTQWLDANA